MIFTFGRDHETKHALAFVRGAAQQSLLAGVIAAVHDAIESNRCSESLVSAIRSAFVEGRSGVWEQAGSWLRKCGNEFHELRALWLEFASHEAHEVRFRVACLPNDIPPEIRTTISERLQRDRSKKVSSMAIARLAQLEVP
jgi:GTP cyclohydrolase II